MPSPFDRFRVLTFDCYGTLIDWERGVLAALRPWANRARPAPDDERLLEAFAAAESAEQLARPSALYPDILRGVVRSLGLVLDVRVSAAEEDALAESVGRWPPFPDTPRALRMLGARCKLVIVSNVDRASIARTIDSIGVRFDGVVTAEDVGAYKPAAPHFVRALEIASRLGARPGEVLHVAQSLFHDHAPAQAMGLATAWIDRRRGKPGFGATRPPDRRVTPDWTFPSLAGFAEAAVPTGRAGGPPV